MNTTDAMTQTADTHSFESDASRAPDLKRNNIDLLIVGAGPAGLKAAQEASQAGLSVWLADENPLPGGQIYRHVTRSPISHADAIFGPDYRAGRQLAGQAFSPRIRYLPNTLVWQITPEKQVFLLEKGETTRNYQIQARFILLAVGAQERTFPMPGWTLPGAMTVGAAQLLMKSAGLLPPAQSVLVGNGPLLLLFATQVIRAGGRIQAILDTSTSRHYLRALPFLPSALRHTSGYLYKGWQLLREIKRARIPYFSGVSNLAIEGEAQVSAIGFTRKGKTHRLETPTVLSHIGVTPATQLANAMGCRLQWNAQYQYWEPCLDAYLQSSQRGVYIAGDASGIVGAAASALSGHLAALGILQAAGVISFQERDKQGHDLQAALHKELAIRPFLAACYPVPQAAYQPADDVMICRCEQVSAGDIRLAAKMGCSGANQLKAFTRCGMGPCQGRMCAQNAAQLLAHTQQRDMSGVGYQRNRFPIKPITLAELAQSGEE
ncbi:FAD/NAD(P)-binding oxidoreductase [Brenneria roseae subsp. roseae]|uniref:NAD(P)/FAD-dependent oxidoreductase n=1 Tax=Brenneria roseae TaxID=1509241 RepID=UPI000D60B97C|nr:NAD(P)/FAD-dependent oxidoreductase [Brenneria roseae]PWC19961.1 FAD/NAD(P)-binding oxidoreductase [Brenneria roseae subsp. roseae]